MNKIKHYEDDGIFSDYYYVETAKHMLNNGEDINIIEDYILNYHNQFFESQLTEDRLASILEYTDQAIISEPNQKQSLK